MRSFVPAALFFCAALGALVPARVSAAPVPDSVLAARVIMAGIDACGPLSAAERDRLSRIPAGAIMLFKKNLTASPAVISAMTGELSALIERSGGARPFIAVDHEGGGVHRFGEGVPRLPSPASYRQTGGADEAALERVKEDATRAAAHLRALGITMNLAPIAEPLTPENSAFLGSRSYGADADFVARAALAFVQGMNSGGVVCVLKHYPGNTGVDPHISKPVWQAGPAELDRLTAPFGAVIAAAPSNAVMLSHVVVPAWDKEHNASLSAVAVQKLRTLGGGNGAASSAANSAGVLVIADDFSMGAASSSTPEDLAVQALCAGVDMVMAWPATLSGTHRAILRALESGRLPRARLNQAAARVTARAPRRAAGENL